MNQVFGNIHKTKSEIESTTPCSTPAAYLCILVKLKTVSIFDTIDWDITGGLWLQSKVKFYQNIVNFTYQN